MSQSIKGKVHEIGQTEQVSETFKKRSLIIEYAENAQYPEYIKFETIQDKTSLLDELRPGDEVEVHFNLRGRPWTNKEGVTSYFNSLVAWKLNITQTSAASQPQYSVPQVTPTDLEDDLPF